MVTLAQEYEFEDGSRGARVHRDVIRNTFKKGNFMACLIELVKNSIDAGAKNIILETADKQILRMIDNGCGMDAARRTAYLRAGYTTGNGSTSAKFGTGARMLPVSFEAKVRVVTVSMSAPNDVYFCDFTDEELISYYTGEHDIHWHCVPKTAKTWPHDHPTGVDVMYTFAKPNSKAIKRGDDLMRRLTNRLDVRLVESDMFLVDGERLPKKRYAPNTRPLIWVFQEDEIPGMGFVKLEIYRLAEDADVDSDLLMTGRSVGEVSFRSRFVPRLPESLRSKVPPLFLDTRVRGLITADFLNEYATHQRDEYYHKIEDDERIKELFRMMEKIQAEASQALGIRLKEVNEEDAAGRKEVTAFLEDLNSRYGGDTIQPIVDSSDNLTGSGKSTDKTPGQPNKRNPHIKLERREFETGEEILATLVIPGGSVDDYDFFPDEARAKVEEVTPATIRMIADELGTGKIKARHRRNGSWIENRYEVVQQRWFRILAQPVVGIDEPATIRAYNIDKLPGGKVAWEITDGPGVLTPGSRSGLVVFSSPRVGFTTVRGYSEKEPRMGDDCEIEITRELQDGPKAICIRGEFFVVRYDGIMGHLQYSKPVTIVKQVGVPHRLTFTPDEPGYVKALREGNLALYLIPHLAHEFAEHFHDSDIEDSVVLQWEIARLAAEISAEMYGAKKIVQEDRR